MSPGENATHTEPFVFKYGNGEISLRLDGEWPVKVVSPRVPGGEPDLPSLVLDSLQRPIAAPPLAALAGGAKSVVISIPDGTRPPVARTILPLVIEELLRAGVDLAKIKIFIAAGVHAGTTPEDRRRLVGEGVSPAVEIVENDCRKAADFVPVGRTRRGTPVMVNRLVREADLNVVIAPLALHYFAGMGGGRKMIVPGACNAETARANHRLTLSDDGAINPMCRSGVLEGNPVHEDMVEGMSFLNNIFLINVILDGWARPRDLVSGDAVKSYLEAATRARGLLEVPVGPRCDLAVAGAGGHPFDTNVIQAHKSIDHAAASVRDGGVVVVAAECAAGIGSDTFLPWFGLGDARAVSRKLITHYELNGHTALALVQKLERLKIILVSSLDRSLVERMGMILARSLDEAVSLAGAYVGKKPLTYILPMAWGILPVAEG